MKIRRILAAVLAVLALSGLGACTDNATQGNNGHADWVWVRNQITHGAICDTGYYYTNHGMLCYADFAASANTVLCNQVGCVHGKGDCGALLPSYSTRQLLYWKDRIYYFDILEPVFYSRNATGEDLKKVGTVARKYIKEQKGIKIGNYGIADGYLYYEVSVYDNITTDEGTSTTSLVLQGIGRIDLATGKDEMLIEEKEEKKGDTKLILCAAREDGLLINRWSGLAVDRNDPNYQNIKLNAKSSLIHLDMETGEKTTLFEKPIRECSNILLISGGKVYYKTYSSVDAEESGFMYSYDLNTGKTENTCNQNVQWLLSSGYAQCYDPVTRERTIFDMRRKKALPYTLETAIQVLNISGDGFVMRLSNDYYYVKEEALADGLQEEDLQHLYAG